MSDTYVDISHLSTYTLKAARTRIINKTIWEVELSNSVNSGEVLDDVTFRGRIVWPFEKILWKNKKYREADFYEQKALQRAVCEMEDRGLVDFCYDDVWNVDDTTVNPTNFNCLEELAKKLLIKWEWYPNCGWPYPSTIIYLQHEQHQWVASISFIGVGYSISASGESVDIAIQNLTELLEEKQ